MYFEHALVKINSGWSKNADRFWNQSCMELTSSNDYFIVSLHLIISNMRPDEFFDESSVLIILSPLIYVHCFTYLLAKTNFPSDFGQTTKFSRYKIKLSLTKYTTVHYNIQTILNLNKKSDLKTQKAQTQPTKKKETHLHRPNLYKVVNKSAQRWKRKFQPAACSRQKWDKKLTQKGTDNVAWTRVEFAYQSFFSFFTDFDRLEPRQRVSCWGRVGRTRVIFKLDSETMFTTWPLSWSRKYVSHKPNISITHFTIRRFVFGHRPSLAWFLSFSFFWFAFLSNFNIL